MCVTCSKIVDVKNSNVVRLCRMMWRTVTGKIVTLHAEANTRRHVVNALEWASLLSLSRLARLELYWKKNYITSVHKISCTHQLYLVSICRYPFSLFHLTFETLHGIVLVFWWDRFQTSYTTTSRLSGGGPFLLSPTPSSPDDSLDDSTTSSCWSGFCRVFCFSSLSFLFFFSCSASASAAAAVFFSE